MGADETAVPDMGIDGIAIKPSEFDVSAAGSLPIDLMTIDFEGNEHFPTPAVIRDLARTRSVRVTVPIRADGFDPLGDHRLFDQLLGHVEFVFVAGHPTYLTQDEISRAIGPRMREARSIAPGGWIGTEGIRGISQTINAPLFALLSPDVMEWVHRIRSSGFSQPIAVYAPTLRTAEPNTVLETIGAYVARRRPVRTQLPHPNRDLSGFGDDAKNIVVSASSKYALIGDRSTIAHRVRELKSAGIDRVIAYPARGPNMLLGT